MKNKVFRTISIGLFACFMQASVVSADAPMPDGGSYSTVEDPTFSLLKTPKSSRQFKTFSYQPYVNGFINENLPLIHVKINDTVSATFFLDTGANVSVISEEFANQLKLKQSPVVSQGKPVQFEGKPVNVVVLDKVDLGAFKFAKYSFVVMKKKRIALPAKQVDGIIGINLLQNFDYLFDFPQHQITMFAPAALTATSDGSPPKEVTQGLTPDEIAALGFTRAKSAPITKSEQDGKMYLHVQCSNNGKTGSQELVLDTGAVATAISPFLAKQIALKPSLEDVEKWAFAGTEYVSVAPVDQIQIGDLVLNNQTVQYSSQKDYDKNVPLSVGMDIMSKYQVLVDFLGQKIYFKPSTPLLPPITIAPQTASPGRSATPPISP